MVLQRSPAYSLIPQISTICLPSTRVGRKPWDADITKTIPEVLQEVGRANMNPELQSIVERALTEEKSKACVVGGGGRGWGGTWSGERNSQSCTRQDLGLVLTGLTVLPDR